MQHRKHRLLTVVVNPPDLYHHFLGWCVLGGLVTNQNIDFIELIQYFKILGHLKLKSQLCKQNVRRIYIYDIDVVISKRKKEQNKFLYLKKIM